MFAVRYQPIDLTVEQMGVIGHGEVKKWQELLPSG